jgi:hypothetical protein
MMLPRMVGKKRAVKHDKKKVSAVSLDSPAKQLAGFIAKFDTRFQQ